MLFTTFRSDTWSAMEFHHVEAVAPCTLSGDADKMREIYDELHGIPKVDDTEASR